MGTVYLATDVLQPHVPVALKLYPSSEHHERLKSEFIALRRLRHPGIARAYHFGVSLDEGRTPFFTMEFVRGRSLRHFSSPSREPRQNTRRRRSKRTGDAVRILTQVVAAVSYLHEHGVLHLDLKPENVLVVEDAGVEQQPMLIDFGLVREASGGDGGLGLGTLPYAAPELFAGQAPSYPADVYSLGAMFYFVLGGRFPVAGNSFEAFYRAHKSARPVPPLGVDPKLDPVVERALLVDPAQRFQTAGEFAHAWRTALQESALSHPVASNVSALTSAFYEPRFAGRTSELKRIERWTNSSRRETPLLTIQGASGMGKSRLLEEVELRLETSAKETLTTRFFGGDDLTALGNYLRELGRCGSTASRSRDTPRRGERSPFDYLLPLIRDGLFWLVDDVHLASASQRRELGELFRRLAANSDAARGAVILTHEGQLELNTESVPAAVCVDLGPLTRKECLQLEFVQRDGRTTLPPATVERLKRDLHSQTGGHPLFFVQGLQELDSAAAGAGLRTLSQRLAEQLEAVPEVATEVVRTMSILDRPTTRDELRSLISRHSDWERCDWESCLRTLVRLGLIAVAGRHLRVTHQQVSATVLSHMDESTRSKRHAALARVFARDRSRRRLEAAWHFRQAGNDEDALKQLRHWLPDTEVHSSREVKLAEELLPWAGSLSTDAPEEAALNEALGDVFEGAGRYEESYAVRSKLVRPIVDMPGRAPKAGSRRARERRPAAAPISRPHSDPRAVRCARKLGAVCQRTGRTEEAITHLSVCVGRDPERAVPDESLRAHAELALLHHFHSRVDEALQHARAGSRLWETLDPKQRRGVVQAAVDLFSTAGQIHIRRLELKQAMLDLEAGLRIAEEHGAASSNVAVLLNNLALARHLNGDLSEALKLFRRAERVANEREDVGALASIRANIAQILSKQGEFEKAIDLLSALEKSAAVKQSKYLQLTCLYSRALNAHLLGHDSASLWREVLQLSHEQDDRFLPFFARTYLAEDLIHGCEYEAAEELLRRPRRRGSESAPLRAFRSARLSWLAALCGKRQVSHRAADDAKRDAGRLPSFHAGWTWYFLALAALERGDSKVAERWLSRAEKSFSHSGIVAGELEVRLCRVDLRLRLVASGGAKSRARLAVHRDLERLKQHKLVSNDLTPRRLGMRLALLEARETALSAVTALRRPGELAAALKQIGSLLRRVSGDAGLTADPGCQLQLLLIETAVLELRGERSAAAASLARLDEWQRQRGVPKDRRRTLWARFGLTLLEPASSAPLRPAATKALTKILSVLADDAAALVERFQAVTAEVGQALPAARVLLTSAPNNRAEWSAAAPPASKSRGVASEILSRAEEGTTQSVELQVEAAAGAKLSDADRAFVTAVFDAVRLAGTGITGEVPFGHSQRSTEKDAPTALLADSRSGASQRETQALTSDDWTTPNLVRHFEAHGFVARSRAARKVLRLVEKLARSDVPILITGESGTGKDHLARILHTLSPRSNAPYVSQNASAIPTKLFEADLFGYQRGAFTGADTTRTGFLFRADGGTFHLEEVCDLPIDLQQSLLRVVEEHAVRPLGAVAKKPLDIRLVASTHRDIEALVERGEFRRDLFYRLNVGRVHVPPLRERSGDLPALVRHFWAELSGSQRALPRATVDALGEHTWPGNVRELVAVLRRLYLEQNDVPSVAAVRELLGGGDTPRLIDTGIFVNHSYDEVQRGVEESYLEFLLEKHGGDLDAIAKELNTTTRSVYRRFERIGLKPKDLRRRRSR